MCDPAVALLAAPVQGRAPPVAIVAGCQPAQSGSQSPLVSVGAASASALAASPTPSPISQLPPQIVWSHEAFDGAVRAITVDGDQLVAVGARADGPAAWTSHDGVIWDRYSVPPPGILDLYEQGVTSPEKLAAWKRPNGAKPIVAATQIGASTWTYGSYVFEKLGLGNRINWVSGGGAQSLIGGLRTKQFDAIMAQPGWMFECVDKGWGKLIFDPRDPKNLERIFGGSIPVGAVIYAQRSTVAAKPEITTALVASIYRAAQWIKKSSVDDVYNLVGEKYLGRHDAAPTKKEMAYYMDKSAKVFNYSGLITEEQYQRAAPVWFREGTGIARMPFNEVFNFKDLLAAQKRLG